MKLGCYIFMLAVYTGCTVAVDMQRLPDEQNLGDNNRKIDDSGVGDEEGGTVPEEQQKSILVSQTETSEVEQQSINVIDEEAPAEILSATSNDITGEGKPGLDSYVAPTAITGGTSMLGMPIIEFGTERHIVVITNSNTNESWTVDSTRLVLTKTTASGETLTKGPTKEDFKILLGQIDPENPVYKENMGYGIALPLNRFACPIGGPSSLISEWLVDWPDAEIPLEEEEKAVYVCTDTLAEQWDYHFLQEGVQTFLDAVTAAYDSPSSVIVDPQTLNIFPRFSDLDAPQLDRQHQPTDPELKIFKVDMDGDTLADAIIHDPVTGELILVQAGNELTTNTVIGSITSGVELLKLVLVAPSPAWQLAGLTSTGEVRMITENSYSLQSNINTAVEILVHGGYLWVADTGESNGHKILGVALGDGDDLNIAIPNVASSIYLRPWYNDALVVYDNTDNTLVTSITGIRQGLQPLLTLDPLLAAGSKAGLDGLALGDFDSDGVIDLMINLEFFLVFHYGTRIGGIYGFWSENAVLTDSLSNYIVMDMRDADKDGFMDIVLYEENIDNIMNSNRSNPMKILPTGAFGQISQFKRDVDIPFTYFSPLGGGFLGSTDPNALPPEAKCQIIGRDSSSNSVLCIKPGGQVQRMTLSSSE
mgnify:CR=1 FL=1